MPGVPSSRGCDACRKQRKRCDQLAPACSRCARLHIECTGAGIRRFVFVESAEAKKEAKRPEQSSRAKSPAQTISRIPHNARDSLAGMIISKVSTNDPRQDIRWAYGPFMADIPRRLGHSVALDAATRAFALSLPPSTRARREPSQHTLGSYTVALEATRYALAHPVESRSIDTLCAVYFLLICQDRIGSPDEIGVHVAGITHMLNNPTSVIDPSSGFDVGLIVVLCSIISAEKYLDTKLKTDASSPCWSTFHLYTTRSIGPPTAELALEADLTRAISGLTTFLHRVHPTPKALQYYDFLSSIIRDFGSRRRESQASIPAADSSTPENQASHESLAARAQLQDMRSYGISLTLGLIMTSILHFYIPSQHAALDKTAWHFTCELVSMASQAVHFMPLGSSFMIPFLNTAWAVGDSSARAQMEIALRLLGVEFEVERAVVLAGKLEGSFGVIKGLFAARKGDGGGGSEGESGMDTPRDGEGVEEEEECRLYMDEWRSVGGGLRV